MYVPVMLRVTLTAGGSTEMPLIERQTAVRPLCSTGKIERVTCERCFTDEVRYCVFSDIINMKVCASCAKMARKLAISLELLEFENLKCRLSKRSKKTLRAVTRQRMQDEKTSPI